eukprot:GCRY01003259.1.p1 GENE.GCRY01003259.1~~GCRY01003259.1.p1  ORF type:complete len:123 (+),score=27.90 GCRY01003259.1:67-435(+)
MIFYSFFKTLAGKEIIVELKNDMSLRGTLHSVDQYLNLKLNDIAVLEPEKFPHMAAVKNVFIRGNVVRYVQLNKSDVDLQLLQDAARREALNAKEGKAEETTENPSTEAEKAPEEKPEGQES